VSTQLDLLAPTDCRVLQGLENAAGPEERSTEQDGAAMLDDVAATYRRFVMLTAEQADTLALYAAHSHAFSAADVTPYIYCTSPEKRSGKTRLLEVSKHLVANPLIAASITPAALFRSITAAQPTLLLDEVDAIFGGQKSERNEDLRALLNAGFEAGATVVRCVPVGRGHEVQRFEVFCPKMLAGLRRLLPDTVLDRSVVIELRRKKPGEYIERFRRRQAAMALHPLRDRLAAWATTNVAALADANPPLPDKLHDRAQDAWEPLLAVADLVGGSWPERARRAATALNGEAAVEDDSVGIQLLRDIGTTFGTDDRLHTKTLLRKLLALEESPWAAWRNDRPLTASALAHILRGFSIRSKQVKIGGKNLHGYERVQFADAWSRYLPTTAPANATGATRQQNQGFSRDRETLPNADGSVSESSENRCEIRPVASVADDARDGGAPVGGEGPQALCASRDTEALE
jgi:hypothetical protein